MSVSKDNYLIAFKDNEVSLRGKEFLKKNIETSLVLKMLFSESSEIYNKLYNEGVINDTFSYENLMDETYCAYLMGGEADDVDKTVEILISEIEKKKNSGFFEEEFELAKKSSWGRQIRSYNSLEAVANSFCANFFLCIGMFDFVDVFNDITLCDINNRLKKMFTDNYSVSKVTPE